MVGYRVSIFLSLVFALLISSFQNCASDLHQPSIIDPSSYDDDCITTAGCKQGWQSEDQLFLRAGGEAYIVVKPQTGSQYTYLEIGGDCYAAEYEENEVMYRILEMVDRNNRIVEETVYQGVAASCHNGRFEAIVRIPNQGRYNFNLVYMLELELVAYDYSGTSYRGPSGRHRLELVPE